MPFPAIQGTLIAKDFLSTDSWQGKMENLLCLNCDRIIRDPVQTLCGHGYCKGCLIKILREDKTCLAKECSENGEDLEYDEKNGERIYFYPNPVVKKQVSKITALCNNHSKGCGWKGTLEEWEKHTEQCDYGTTACPDCEEVVPKNKSIKSNEKSEASCDPPTPIQASEDEAGSRALLLMSKTGRLSRPTLNADCVSCYYSSGNIEFYFLFN